MRFKVLVVTFIAVMSLRAVPSYADIGCPVSDKNDGWGGYLALFEPGLNPEATIRARSEIRHYTDHVGGCWGIIWAKAVLLGLNANCNRLEGHTHYNASDNVKITSYVCGNLSRGMWYHSGGIHWWHFNDGDEVFSESEMSYRWPTPEEECYFGCLGDPACECACEGGFWNDVDCGDSCGCNYSPLMINLQSNAAVFKLTSPADGVCFDIAGRGTAYQVAWTREDSNSGWIALDRNGNGRVDDGTELFGTATRLRTGERATNGFDALREFDANGDGKVDSDDPVYASLRVWLDLNHNGVSEPYELVPFEQLGISALFTDFTEMFRRDRNGNLYKYRGTAAVAGPNGQQLERRVYDVFLATAK